MSQRIVDMLPREWRIRGKVDPPLRKVETPLCGRAEETGEDWIRR